MSVCTCPDMGMNGHGFSCPYGQELRRPKPTRIYDDPNHPQYGPVRRLWVVLVQLGMLEGAERYSRHHDAPWDELLAVQIERHPNVPESHYQRAIIGTLLEGWT